MTPLDPSRFTQPRSTWTRREIQSLFTAPLLELVYTAQTVHRAHHRRNEVQLATLLSLKTGGCPEDCAYCPQSVHFDTGLEREKRLDEATVLEAARRARDAGATRFCMGAAWRAPRDRDVTRVAELVGAVKGLGLETCVTLGMLTEPQARELKTAGLDYYNHNLDTSPEYYPSIISTRTYEDRLTTLANVRAAGIAVCCGGIIGLGEDTADRVGLLHALATQDPHPESVPINTLVRVEGTPLAEAAPVAELELVRMIAVARLTMPATTVRLSAGRTDLGDAAHGLCFLAGANSVFFGDELLTTANPADDADIARFSALGVVPAAPT